MVQKYLELISERVLAKAVTRYGLNYVLVVAVDDYLQLREPSAADALHELATHLLPTLRLDFGRVVFVGVAGNIFQSYNITGTAYFG
jgi:hypothetical protein